MQKTKQIKNPKKKQKQKQQLNMIWFAMNGMNVQPSLTTHECQVKRFTSNILHKLYKHLYINIYIYM